MADQIKVLLKRNAVLDDDQVFFAHSKRISVGDEENDFYSYVSDDILIEVDKRGFLSLFNCNGAEDSICFYPDQLDHLKQALDIALAQKDTWEKKW